MYAPKPRLASRHAAAGIFLHTSGLSLRAAETVDVSCKNFEVRASESVDVHSDGGMQLSGVADVRVNANGDVIVKGEMIYLN